MTNKFEVKHKQSSKIYISITTFDQSLQLAIFLYIFAEFNKL